MHSLSTLRWITPAALLLATLVAGRASAQRTEDRYLELQVGKQETLNAAGVTAHSVGNDAVIDVKPYGGRLIIIGRAPGQSSLLLIYGTDRQVNYAVTVTAPTTASKGSDSADVPERVNVRLDLYYVEVNRTSELQLGVAWPAALGSPQNVITGSVPIEPSGPASFTMSLSQVLPTMDMLHATGWGRFLRHATVVTTNGTQAEFDSGGEVYLASVTETGAAAFQTLTFGSRINVTPNYDKKSGRVEVVVETEVSDLVESGSDFPGRNRTTSKSTANLALGQAIAVGGVEARSESRGKTGLPGLSQIPILGILFGSHGTSETEKENVVLIVPTVVEGVPSRTAGLLDEVVGVYNDFTGNLDDVNLLGILDAAKKKTRRP